MWFGNALFWNIDQVAVFTYILLLIRAASCLHVVNIIQNNTDNQSPT